ncbi:MAG: glycine cleavage T C-terminal barrel domain-containing protein [Bryobacterales bacterium]|nr:glycine cleavage T C-terminal barrel domain-containing protein [Bryobacterales bacterium]
MNLTAYEALREHAAIVDLSGRGLIAVKDEDRARLLHAMTTNVVEGLKAGEGTVALFLNEKGRILAEALVLCREEDYLLDTEAATRDLVMEHLDHYIIMDVVELEDVSAEHTVWSVEGPGAAGILTGLGASLPGGDFEHTAWGEARVARYSYTGGPGYRIYAPLAMGEELAGKLRDAGAVECDLATADAVRLEFGRARHGVEFSDQHLVHEAQLLSHVSFTKGCYLGQEIVERVRSRGNVNRLLVRLMVDSKEAPAADTPVLAGEKEAGQVRNAAFSPALGKSIAFALVRSEYVKASTAFTVSGAVAALAESGRPG